MVGWCSMGTFNDPCSKGFPVVFHRYWAASALEACSRTCRTRWLPTSSNLVLRPQWDFWSDFVGSKGHEAFSVCWVWVSPCISAVAANSYFTPLKMCHFCLPYHLPCVFFESPKKHLNFVGPRLLLMVIHGYPLDAQAYGWPSLKHPRSDEAGGVFAQPYGGLHCLELSPQFEPASFHRCLAFCIAFCNFSMV